jgi:hypothetical protein
MFDVCSIFGTLDSTSTMAEPMDVVDEVNAVAQHSRPWADLWPVQPRTFVEVHNRRDAFLTSGEFFCLQDSVPILLDATAHGQIVVQSTVARILCVESNPSTVVANLLVLASEFPHFPLPPSTPPNDRTYLEFPTELVWTDVVHRIPASQVQSEAFVFVESWIRTGEGGMCVGMTNGFFVRRRLSLFWDRFEEVPSHTISGFHPFPHYDSYSKRAWDNLIRLSRHISYELGRASISQGTRSNKLLDYSLSDWKYLRYRLATADNECLEKEGVSSILFIRRNGTKEVLKCAISKYQYRMDTSSLFDHLCGVLGQSIVIGLRLPNPRSPTLRGPQRVAFSVQRSHATDGFNLFHPLPAISQDGTNYRPRHRGVDFHYDKAKSKLRLSIRFRRAHPGDVTVRATFGLGPVVVVVPDSDGEESASSSDTEEEGFLPTDVILVVGDLIGSDDYLLQVRRILNQRTHVVLDVIESNHNDFVVGVERILTMAAAQLLYVEYNNQD